ncbi:lysine histidine transporter-like 8 [Syzygium oleosum]|uniref:lysine histidine transporter-like 8 n=1 Tax=Syzygium oleosum TaxID=219896 RepID=UPI0011D22CD3|nr:lysine histidine transporter-like 8 [Syzygium oleosum]
MGEVGEIVDDGFYGLTLDDNAVPTKAAHVAVTITTGSVVDEATAEAMAAGGPHEENPQDGWLPITESRGGSTVSAVFHVLCSGMGIQALMLPVAFASLGWVWGILILSLGFLWQLYTIWALVQLHELVPGTRYSRFLHLSIAAFGPRLGKLLAIFPVMYLSGGTCVMEIITGGRAMELLFKTMCGGDGTACSAKPPNGVEWFLLFTFIAIVIAQRPNLHSIAKVSLFGAITAVSYGALIWILSVAKGRPAGISYKPLIEAKSDAARIGGVLNAIGIIALSFRGHNLVLEIQGTLPSTPKCLSKRLMWRAVIISYSLIALCLYSLAIGGFWAYGSKIPNGGLYIAFPQFHGQDTPKLVMGLIYLLVAANCLSTFQIYAMPVFDNLELRYTSIRDRRCSRRARTSLRVFFGCLAFFVAVALPFLGSLAPLIGGMTSTLTFVLPCFMWLAIKRPRRRSGMWWLNVGLGWLGVVLWVVMVVAAIWVLVDRGINANFFHP